MSLASLAVCVTVILLQAKLFEQLLDHLGQLCGEVRASRDVLRRKVLGKRKFGSISLSNEEEQALGKLKKVSCTSAFSAYNLLCFACMLAWFAQILFIVS